jgi:hypothetical protein
LCDCWKLLIPGEKERVRGKEREGESERKSEREREREKLLIPMYNEGYNIKYISSTEEMKISRKENKVKTKQYGKHTYGYH